MRIATATSLILAATLAACGGSSTSSGSLQDQSRNAMPRGENLKMSSPSATSSMRDGSDGSLEQNSIAGTASAYFGATVGLSGVVNGSTGFILGILKGVTDLPATSCTEDTCTWGPGSGALEANNYKLVVAKKSGPDRFEFRRIKGRPLLALGHARPVRERGVTHEDRCVNVHPRDIA